MAEKLNLSPVEELLKSIVSPEELANELDALAFDYIRVLSELELETSKSIMHEKTSQFFWYLQLLRDTFRKCKIN